jgi:general secretion pathway protein D
MNSFRFDRRLALALICALVLTSCAHEKRQDLQIGGDGLSAGKEGTRANRQIGRPTEMSPVSDQGDLGNGVQNNVSKFYGTGRLLNTIAQTSDVDEYGVDDNGVTLNFVEADVAKVAEAVLGVTLGYDYIIAPSIAEKITLRSNRPVPKEAVLAALEQAFALSGLALIEEREVYRIVSMADANRASSGFSVRTPNAPLRAGYGVHIVPLKFIAASQMEEVITPLLPSGTLLSIDQTRNLVFLGGTSGEVNAALEAIDLFDVNWLAAMTFALYTPEHASAEALVEELVTIFDHSGNPMAGRIELMPLPRINAILSMTAEPELLKEVERWILRLDRRGDGEEQQIFVYNVQHGTAEDITASLISILSGGDDVQGSGRGEVSQENSRPSGGAQEIHIGPSSAGVRIAANTTNNAIMIYSGGREYQMILDAIRQIDIPVDQVLIEATIAEVTLNDELKYGVQWFFDNAQNTFTQSSNSAGSVASKFPGFSYTYFTTSAQVALNALESVTDVKVLSSPKLVTLNNRTGFLQVGDQVPVASQSAVSIVDANAPIVNAVQFRDTGVILEVTPRINSSGMVLLEVSQEVSDVIPTTTSGIDSPTIQQRKIKSTVTVDDGQTIALGGLIRETESRGKSGLPILSRVPFLGAAFGSQDYATRRTELLIFITPRVIRNTEDAKFATEYLRGRLKNSKFFDKVK